MVAALGRTGTDPQLMNGSVRVFLEGGQTSLVACIYEFTRLSVLSRCRVVRCRRSRLVWKACGHVSIYAPIDG
jgi:hypothetical protein